MNTRSPKIRNLAAAVIGNALEWYDFLVFAFMTPIISQVFFPVTDGVEHSLNNILRMTAIFGVGFFMRPIGGILLGIYADKKGRKAAMVMVTTLMAIALALITVTPSYASIGVLAPIIVLIARLIQGFSAGGEFGTATALLIEMAPANRRGFYGSWQMTGQMMGLLIGAGAGTLTTAIFSPEEIQAWAWRIPFLFGLLIIPVAVYIRNQLEETETFATLQHEREQKVVKQATMIETLAQVWREILIGIGLVCAATVTVYITFTYLVTFSTEILRLPLQDTFSVQLLGALWVVVLIPLFGLLSDRVSKGLLLKYSLGLFLVVMYPVYSWLVAAPSIERLLIVQLVVGVFTAGFFAVFSNMMAILFPTHVRSLGMSLSYNIAVLVLGGFSQFFVTWLIQVTLSPLAPTFYVMGGLALGLIAAFSLGKRADADIPD